MGEGGVIKSRLSISWEGTVTAPDWMDKRTRPTNKAGVTGLLGQARILHTSPRYECFRKEMMNVGLEQGNHEFCDSWTGLLSQMGEMRAYRSDQWSEGK